MADKQPGILNRIVSAYQKSRKAPEPKNDVPDVNKEAAADFVKGFNEPDPLVRKVKGWFGK